MREGFSLVAKARTTALLSQQEMGARLGVSAITLGKWERDPDHYMNAERLRAYWNNVGEDGHVYLKAYVEGIFDAEE